MKRSILSGIIAVFLFFQAYQHNQNKNTPEAGNIAKNDKSGQYTLQTGVQRGIANIDEKGKGVPSGRPDESFTAEIIKAEKKFKRNKKKYGAVKYDGPNKFAEFQDQIRTREGRDVPDYRPNYKLIELNKAYQHSKRVNNILKLDAEAKELNWIERGPANVPGRTRGLLVMPEDPKKLTWLAGSVGGGIWKTTDGGKSWVNKTPDLPNLATTVLAMSEKNSQIIYAGTGEGFYNRGAINGDGIFKSEDGGNTWRQLSFTANNDDFRNINRIIVDPENHDILVICSNSGSNYSRFTSGIYKSVDGGQTFKEVLKSDNRIQHIIYSPNDFSIQYAAVNGFGVVKSVDSGESWDRTGRMFTSGRVELAVSPTHPSILYAAAEGNASGNSSNLYISEDAGNQWTLVLEEESMSNINWFGTQGWYNNSLAVNPYDPYIVYAGGIDIWKMEIKPGEGSGAERITSVDENNTKSFFTGTDWGGPHFNGALGTGEDWFEDDEGLPEAVSASDYTSVAILFGPGKKQNAHRFTVPDGMGAGVEPHEYTYRDYVEVPFQVWDIKNNRQLMVSFRDQEGDGKFDLEERDQENSTQGREYIFISAITYNESNPDPNIARNGGMSFKNIYSLWPNLKTGADWDENNLPESSLVINYGSIPLRYRKSIHLTDAYEDFQGKNKHVHPDHHSLIIIPTSATTFKILNSNDGGVYVSNSSATPGEKEGDWEFAGHGLNTGQFYGFDKRPRADEYIGGLQDNGTWKSPRGRNPNAETDYIQQLGGDGFDVVWHYSDPQKIVASTQYNMFRRSVDAGRIYRPGRTGLDDTGEENAPFFSRLGYSIRRPNVLFTVGKSGVWKSNNFAESWFSIPIKEDWAFGSFTNIKVSLADPNIVWAGGAMSSNGRLYVSTNEGETFSKTNNYEAVPLGRISGLATHPAEPHTAYALFSFANAPKILRTTDLGNTWEEISGFGKNTTSANGFPDVAVYSLLVHPHQPNTIWAGTEIGIVESKDNGESWSLLISSLPSVSIWAMKVVDDQIIVATHGRGIWSLQVPELQREFIFDENVDKEKLEVSNYPNPVYDFTTISFYLTHETPVSISIFNSDGKFIEEINLGNMKRGQGFLAWRPKLPGKGIYIIRLNTDKGSVSNKMLLI